MLLKELKSVLQKMDSKYSEKCHLLFFSFFGGGVRMFNYTDIKQSHKRIEDIQKGKNFFQHKW